MNKKNNNISMKLQEINRIRYKHLRISVASKYRKLLAGVVTSKCNANRSQIIYNVSFSW